MHCLARGVQSECVCSVKNSLSVVFKFYIFSINDSYLVLFNHGHWSDLWGV